MNVAWALILSTLILVLLSTAFFIFVRSTFKSFKNLTYISKKYPIYSVLFVIINFSLILVSIQNPIFLLFTWLPVLVSIMRLAEFMDDRYVDSVVGLWAAKQEFLYFKIIPNQFSNTSVADMEKFFLVMHSLYSSKSEKDIRVNGTFYDEFTLEIIAKDENVAMYARIYKRNLGTIMSGAKLYLPNVVFEQVTNNELDLLPEDFNNLQQDYNAIDIGEFSYLKPDLFPTKFYNQIEHSLPEYRNNPITQLFSYLSGVTGGDMVVLQLIIRPQDISKRAKELGAVLNKVRREFSENSAVSVSADGRISQLTPNEVDILERADRKMNIPNFDIKFRFGLFGKKSTGKKYLGGIMSYLKIFATDKQLLIPNPKSWIESDSAFWGPFWDKLYFGPETKRRQLSFYKCLKSRSHGGGGKSKYWDLYSLSTMIQIPSVFESEGGGLKYQLPNITNTSVNIQQIINSSSVIEKPTVNQLTDKSDNSTSNNNNSSAQSSSAIALNVAANLAAEEDYKVVEVTNINTVRGDSVVQDSKINPSLFKGKSF